MIKVLLPGGFYEDFPDADGYTVQPATADLHRALLIWKIDPAHKSHELLGVFPSGGWVGFRPTGLGPGLRSAMGFRPADSPPPEF